MSPEAVKKFLQLFDCKVPGSQQRTGWVVSDCPLGPWKHEGGKSGVKVFGVKTEQGDPRSNCFACGWHGSLGDLILEMSALNSAQFKYKLPLGSAGALIEEAIINAELNLDTPDIEQMLFGEKQKPQEFPDWWLQSFPVLPDAPPSLQDYASSRSIGLEVAQFLDIRVDIEQRRICFPVRDFKGVLRGLHGRAVDPKVDPRYRMYTFAKRNNPIYWLNEQHLDLSKPVVVVEGPFDVASVARVYRNVTSPLFVNPSVEKLKRMGDCLEWITMYDRGKGGDAGRAKVSNVLHKDVVVQHVLPPEGFKDPGELDVEQLVDLLEGKVPIDPLIC